MFFFVLFFCGRRTLPSLTIPLSPPPAALPRPAHKTRKFRRWFALRAGPTDDRPGRHHFLHGARGLQAQVRQSGHGPFFPVFLFSLFPFFPFSFFPGVVAFSSLIWGGEGGFRTVLLPPPLTDDATTTLW